MTKSLVISLHDISPRYYAETRDILAELNRKGYRTRTLASIPHAIHDGSLLDHSQLATLLQTEADTNEFCMHGLTHEKSMLRPEFRSIGYTEARKRLGDGKETFQKLGITPFGFVPPYWGLGKEELRAVQDTGFRMTETTTTIRDLARNETYHGLPLWMWPFNEPLDTAFRLADHILARSLTRPTAIARVAFHVHDAHSRKALDCGLALVDYYVKEQGRTIQSYQDAFLTQTG